MAQIGVLFDVQKLGSGFYGYTAFRILFSVIPARDLVGCVLYHGEVGDGRSRPYCIAVESDSAAVIARVRQTFGASMARGLLAPGQRILDEASLHEEVLAMAARIDSNGVISGCTSRWLQEAWQRAQGQSAITPTEPKAPPIPKPLQETRVPPKLPESIPMALRWSPGGRKSLAFLIAFCVAGALVPWVGWALSVCALLFTAGVADAIAIRWRLGAERAVSGRDVMAEAIKLLASKPVHEAADKLSAPAPAASPLLRRLHSSARATDLGASCLLSGQQERADLDSLAADVRSIRCSAFLVAAAALLSLSAMWVFQGLPAALLEAPRLVFTGLAGFCLLQSMAALLAVRGERQLADIQRLLSAQWMPALARALPAAKTEFHSVEQALRELTQEFQAMRVALERRRDADFVDTMSDLRTSLEQLTPVLAGFREPFVLQAVPAAPRVKAMSVSA